MDKDNIKEILDESLQRCQEYPYKDWDAEKVEDLIKRVKTILNKLPQGDSEASEIFRKLEDNVLWIDDMGRSMGIAPSGNKALENYQAIKAKYTDGGE